MSVSILRRTQENQRTLGWSLTFLVCLFWSLFEIRSKMIRIIFLPITFSVVVASKLCPPQCFCYEASDLVNCRSQGFTHIPHSIPHGTWLLDLSGNKLSELRSTSFSGIWALRVLLISQSSMQMVHSQVCWFWKIFFVLTFKVQNISRMFRYSRLSLLWPFWKSWTCLTMSSVSFSQISRRCWHLLKISGFPTMPWSIWILTPWTN